MRISGAFGSSAKNDLRFAQTATNAPVYRIVQWQLFATIVVFATCAIFDWVAAYSALLGGAACLIPGSWSAWRLLRQTTDVGAAAGHMMMAEVGKMLLTIALFATVFVWVKPLDAILFFGTFAGLQGLYILVPAFDKVTAKRADGNYGR